MHRILRRRAPALAAIAIAIAATACSDGAPTGAPGPAPAPPGALAAIPCTARVRARRVECASAVVPGAVRGDRIIGGQRVNVFLQSGNVAYDSVAERFSADVTVQNLLVQRLGSDGTTVTGVKVFFASGPTATAGTGVVTVANPDGSDLFTGSDQPYFYYPGALPTDAVTPAKRWEWSVPRSVETFAFVLYVSAPVVPAIVVEMWPGGNRDVYRMGIDGNDVVKLSASTATDATPTVARGRVVFTSYRDGNAELYAVPLKGGAETRLTATPDFNETSPALSPDGTRLAWAGAAPGAVTRIYTGDAAAGGSALANPGASSETIEATPNWASASRLAFTMASSGSPDIYALTLGGSPTLLAGGTYAEVEGAWSPDGARLAFASNRSGDTELYLLTVATGAVARVTTRTGSDSAPTWLSDGRIVYTCTSGGQFHLCIVDPADPPGWAMLNTPYEADHARGVLF